MLQYLRDHNYVCYKEGHEHWCVGGQRAIAAGLTEFCGCQHIYAGCQAFPADPAATAADGRIDLPPSFLFPWYTFFLC